VYSRCYVEEEPHLNSKSLKSEHALAQQQICRRISHYHLLVCFFSKSSIQ